MKRSTPKLNVNNRQLLKLTATKHFRTADFSNSGRIDDDETMEIFTTITQDGCLTMPYNVSGLLKNCTRARAGVLQLPEFLEFINAAVDAALAPPPAPTPAPPPGSTHPASPAPPPVQVPVSPPSPYPTKADVPARAAAAAPAPAPAAPAPKPAPQPAASSPVLPTVLPTAADAHFGNVRVRLVEAEGLPGGCAGVIPTVAVTEATRRRTRRGKLAALERGVTSASWMQGFDFPCTSRDGQVVVDLMEHRPATADGPPSRVLGKVVVDLCECRDGIPHVVLKPLVLGAGQLVVRVLFDVSELPSEAEEMAAYLNVAGDKSVLFV